MSDEKNTTPETQDEQPYEGILGDFPAEEEEAAEPAQPEEKEKKKTGKKEGGKKGAVIAGITASVLLLGCLGYLGVMKMREAGRGAVNSKTMSVSKEMLACYYQEMINMYVEYYGEETLAAYFGMDLSQSLKDQESSMGDGSTWFDTIMNSAKETASQELQVAEYAKAQGFRMTPEMEQQVEEELATYDLSVYPAGVTEDDLRDMLRLQTYALEYFDEYTDSIEFSDEELEAYFAEHQVEYENCGLAYFSFYVDEEEEETPVEETAPDEEATEAETAGEEAAEEETAGEEATEEETADENTQDEDVDAENASETAEEETAEEDTTEEQTTEAESTEAETENEDFVSDEEASDEEASDEEENERLTAEKAAELAEAFRKAGSAEEFEDLAVDVLVTYEGYTQEDADNVRSALYSNDFGYTEGSELAEWAFGGAKVGETYVIENDGAYYVYMLTREPGRDNSNTIDIRHILFMTSNHLGEDGDEAAALAECWRLAENCLDEWKSGEATEESFGKLAERDSEDTGSQSNGGLYEYVAEGDMVSEFNDWCFDPNRQPGDTGLVETTYGVHVMYFVSTDDPVWKADIFAALGNAAIEAWFTDLEEMYPVTYDDELINSIEG